MLVFSLVSSRPIVLRTVLLVANLVEGFSGHQTAFQVGEILSAGIALRHLYVLFVGHDVEVTFRVFVKENGVHPVNSSSLTRLLGLFDE